MRLSGLDPVPLSGPPPIPLVGPFGSVVRFFDDPVGQMLALHAKYGEMAALVDRNPGFVFAFGAAMNREVVGQPALYAHSSEIPVRAPPGSALARFNQVLPFTNGDAHRRRRRLLQPAFQRSAIEGYAPDIVGVTERVLARWPSGEPVDVAALLRELTAAIAVKTLFGLDALDASEDLGRLEAALLDALSSPLSVALPLAIPGTPYHRALTTSAQVEARLRRLLAERRAGPGGGTDALSILLAARDEDGSALGDDELVGECNGLFVAGYDTSAQTLTWTLFLLAQHPDVLAALLAEVETLDGPPRPADLGRLVVLDRVLKESMRLLPAAPMLFLRVTTAPAKLGGVELPEGATVVLSPLVTHREPTRFPEPARFRPERWETLEPSSWEYLPFGVGARMCLGAAFGGQLLRIVLPMILRRFGPAVVPGTNVSRVTRGIALAPKHGLRMVLHPAGRPPGPPAPVTGDIGALVEM